jgi:hypothetical protein
MKKLFISQAMSGKSDKELMVERDSALVYVEYNLGEEYEEIDSSFPDIVDEVLTGDQQSAFGLGKEIELLAASDAAYFCTGWYKNRGCQIEHLVCEKYHIPIVYD